MSLFLSDRFISFVVGDSLEGIDEVVEFKCAIHISVESANPVSQVFFVQVSAALKISEECSQVVIVDGTMGKLVHSSENGKRTVIKLRYQFLLLRLNFF